MMVICDKTDIVNEKMEMLIVVFKFFFLPQHEPYLPSQVLERRVPGGSPAQPHA